METFLLKRDNQQGRFRMKKTLFLKKFELEKLMYEGKLTQKEIATKFNVSRSSVQRLQKKFDLVSLEDYEKRYPKNLSELQKKCLNGSILGDDCVHNFGSSIYASLNVAHEISQKEYIQYKYSIWENFVTKSGIRKTERNCNGKKRTVLSFKTGCHPIFKEYRDKYYEGKIKRMKKEHIVNLMNPISLSFLFQDDGSRCKNGGLAIHTNCFTLEEVKMFCNELQNNFGWICYPQKRKENQYVAFFSNKTSIDFAEYILPYVIPSLRYKLEGVYNHSKNPQRLHVAPFVHNYLLEKDKGRYSLNFVATQRNPMGVVA